MIKKLFYFILVFQFLIIGNSFANNNSISRSDFNLTSFNEFKNTVESNLFEQFKINKNIDIEFTEPSVDKLKSFTDTINNVTEFTSVNQNGLVESYFNLLEQNPKHIFKIHEIAKVKVYALEGTLAINKVAQIENMLIERLASIHSLNVTPDTLSNRSLSQLKSTYQKLIKDLAVDMENGSNRFNEITGQNITTKQFSWLTAGLSVVGIYFAAEELFPDEGCTDPTVNLSINSSTLQENSGTATISATLASVTSASITIPLVASGSATSGTDYQAISSITIAAGNATGTATLTPINDSIYDANSDETVTFNIGENGQGFCIGDTRSVTASIVDDETAPTLTLTKSAAAIAENAGTSITLTATLNIATFQTVTVALTPIGTATEGTDYTTIADITITAGARTGTTSFTPTNDTMYETATAETAIIAVTSVTGGGATESGTQSETIAINADSDPTPTVTLATSASTVAEGGSDLTLTATLSNPTHETVTISIDGTGGSATEGSDFATVTDITITSGNTTGTAAFNPTEDSLYDATSAESAVIAISGVAGGSAAESGTQTASISITDGDSAPTVTIASSASTVGEGGSDLTLTATLSVATYANVTVSLGTSGTATSGSDYTAVASTVTISAGSTTGTTTLNPTDDSGTYENTETVIVAISGVSGGSATESGTQTTTVSITENEAAPTVTLATSASSVSEAGSNLTLTATLSISTYEAVTVTLDPTGTGTEGTDYATIANISISAGATTGTVVFNPTDDSKYESSTNETAIVGITGVAGGGASESGTQTASITITENDSAPTVTLASSSTTLDENSNSAITITATLSNTTFGAVTVALTPTGTAIEGTDYPTISDITIAEDATTGTASFTTTDDCILEGNTNETAVVAISGVSGGEATAAGSSQSVALAIDDDEGNPKVTLASSATSITEGAGTITLTASIGSCTYGQNIVVSLNVAGTGTEGTDYNDIPSTLTITTGDTSATQAFTPVNDSLFDAASNETAIISISGVSGGTASEQGTQSKTLTIVDAQSAPTVTLASSASSVGEDASDLTLTATLSTATYAAVTVTIDDTGGTGTVDTDFAEVSDITISAGSTTGTTAFNPTPDAHYDAASAETGVIAISGVSGGSATELNTQVATISIIDAESAPTVTLASSSNSLTEDGSNATLTASLSNATYGTVTIALATSGSATDDTDYAVDDSISISAGSTSGTATFNPTPDSLFDAASAESAVIDISVSGASATESGTQQQTIVIADNESAPTVTLSSSASTVNDAAGNLTITATLSVATYANVVVGISTSGTATDDTDYVVDDSISISASSTSGTATFNPTAESTYEGTETATLAIASVSGGSAEESGTQTASITITEFGMNLNSTNYAYRGDSYATQFTNLTEYGNVNDSSYIHQYTSHNIHKGMAYYYAANSKYLDGSGENIYITDGGCDPNHAEFKARFDAGTSRIYDPGGNGLRADSASSHHCNFVASIAFGSNADDSNGMMGVAYNADYTFSEYGPSAFHASVNYLTDHYKMLAEDVAVQNSAAWNNSWGSSLTTYACNNSWISGSYNVCVNNGLFANGAVWPYTAANVDDVRALKTIYSLDDHEAISFILNGSTASAFQTATTNYINSLNALQDETIIVFAIGNVQAETQPGLLSALPIFYTQLEEAFLGVGWAQIRGSSISSSTVWRGGNQCGELMKNCIFANGSDMSGAKHFDGTTSHYATDGYGSSYSAPMVAGSIALLKQAFPNLTPADIQERILASANNSYFTPSAQQTFTNGIQHGYNAEWGHGLLDLDRALKPILTSYNGLGASGLSSGLAIYRGSNLNLGVGNLLSSTSMNLSSSFGSINPSILSNIDIYAYDAMYGGFKVNFSNLFQQTSPKHIDMMNALVADINRLSFSLDIDDTKNYSYSFSNVFGKVGNKEVGQLGFSLESTSAPIRHFNQINNGSSFYLASFENPFTDNLKIGFGINAQYQFDDTAVLIGYHNNEIRLSNNLEDIDQVETFAISFTQQNDYFNNITILTGLMIEEDTLLDSKGSGALGFHGTNPHSLFAGVNFEKVIGNNLAIKFVSTVGYSTLDTPVHSLIGEVSPITSSSFNLILNKYGVIHDDDRLSVSIGQPNRVETGTMTFRIPELADSEGNLTYANREIDLNPSGRQLDFGIDYVTKLDNNLILGFKHTLSKDFNHIDSSELNNTVTFTAKIDF